MYLAFEFLFYLGLLLLIGGMTWLLVTLVTRRWKRLKWPLAMLFLGFAAIAAPAIYTRLVDVDLGPRMVLVQGEKHITLTGWDGTDYTLLRQHPETIVLQIANADVNDDTMKLLTPMANLRELDLNDSQVSDEGLKQLAMLTGLEVIRLRGTRVTDAGLESSLSRLPKLKRLDVRETAVSKEAVQRWKEAGEGRRAFQ